MARTKASVGLKVASGKSSKARCNAAPEPSGSGTSASTSGGSRSSGSGNRVCPRETPAWQRRITLFFPGANVYIPDNSGDGNSDAKSKKILDICSDNETPIQIDDEKPTNRELDETIELQPLTGEESHRIEEFFPKARSEENGRQNEKEAKQSSPVAEKVAPNSKGKGKGKGKKTKQKENINDTNVEKQKPVKRALETEDDYLENTKKVKIDV